MELFIYLCPLTCPRPLQPEEEREEKEEGRRAAERPCGARERGPGWGCGGGGVEDDPELDAGGSGGRRPGTGGRLSMLQAAVNALGTLSVSWGNPLHILVFTQRALLFQIRPDMLFVKYFGA
jgi:hypothetical protein